MTHRWGLSLWTWLTRSDCDMWTSASDRSWTRPATGSCCWLLIFQWPQNKQREESERTSCLFIPPWQLLSAVIHAGTVFGSLRGVWEIFMNCEPNFIFCVFPLVCRIACHKKCEVKVRVKAFSYWGLKPGNTNPDKTFLLFNGSNKHKDALNEGWLHACAVCKRLCACVHACRRWSR